MVNRWESLQDSSNSVLCKVNRCISEQIVAKPCVPTVCDYPPDVDKPLWEQLDDYLRTKPMSLSEAAEIAHIDKSTLSRIITQKWPNAHGRHAKTQCAMITLLGPSIMPLAIDPPRSDARTLRPVKRTTKTPRAKPRSGRG